MRSQLQLEGNIKVCSVHTMRWQCRVTAIEQSYSEREVLQLTGSVTAIGQCYSEREVLQLTSSVTARGQWYSNGAVLQ